MTKHKFEVSGPPVTGRRRTLEELRQWEVRASGQAGGASLLVTTRVVLDDGTSPVIWMYEAAGGSPLGCLRPLVKSLDEPGEIFELYAADGGQLAVLGYENWRLWPWPRRSLWRLRTTDGGKVVGGVGTWYAWTLAFCLFPVWWLLMLVGLVLAWLDWDFISWENVAGSPSRIRWFQAGQRGWVMDHRADGSYRVLPDRLDYRIAYAQGIASAWNDVSRYSRKGRRGR